MASLASRASTGSFTLRAHAGDAKTLLAFNLDQAEAANLAGFTIQCQPDGKDAYYLINNLRFADPAAHAQVTGERPESSVNSPFHKFRWLHVPGSFHQGTDPFFGPYTYTVTPRYFDAAQHMLPLDPTRSASVQIPVVPFKKGTLQLGFTRGFTQSQAFVHHFGRNAPIQPKGTKLLFDTSAQAGTAGGDAFTFVDEYRWLGFTARQRVFDILQELAADTTLQLAMFAYDLAEPDACGLLLQLAGEGRVRMILDNSGSHHNASRAPREDQFEDLFQQAKTGESAILRGNFDRYAHDKVLIVSDASGARTVLTGSTNFSVTGFYVNSNHVLVFDDREVAQTYLDVFNQVWAQNVSAAAWRKSDLGGREVSFNANGTPPTSVSFAPHTPKYANTVLQEMADRIGVEAQSASGSVLFAVMDMGAANTGPVVPALEQLHENQQIFSFGISDNPQGICLYSRGSSSGVLVTGRPTSTMLPPPFDQVPGVGLGHQIHHKFVVCGFNGPDPVVFCGSSNLSAGGEHANGDNLLAVRDADVATAFAIEALGLVDHFNFLDRFGKQSPTLAAEPVAPPADLIAAAASVGWFLGTTDQWTKPYFDAQDLHNMDRQLFA